MTVQVGDIYESTDSRRPKRVMVDEIWPEFHPSIESFAVCRVKRPGESRYTGYTEISTDRLTPKCHWRKVRSGK